jgi:hypothetical protein
VNGGAGADTLRLLVSDDLFASQPFRDELAAFAPGKSAEFASLDLSVQGVERLEVVAHGTTLFTSGRKAVKPGPEVAALLRDGDLWGLA